MSYACKDPECTESIGWHLLHADPDCIEENQQVLAEWVAAAEVALAGVPELVVNIDAHAEGYEGQTVSVILKPVGAPPPVVEEPPLMPPMDM